MANEIRISASDMETRASQYENEANTVEEVIAKNISKKLGKTKVTPGKVKEIKGNKYIVEVVK